MANPFSVRRIEAKPLTIPLIKPFGIAGGAQVIAENVLVTVELEDGTLGFGEAAPFQAFNGETFGSTLAAIERARSVVLGKDARCWRVLSDDLHKVTQGSAAAQSAIETALFDAFTRRAGIPLWAFFGGAQKQLITDITITTGSTQDARDDAKARHSQGFSRLKVKVGGSADDVARVVAIAESAPGAEIFLDANGGLNAANAISLVEAVRAHGVQPILFEQPVAGDDLEGMAEVSRRAEICVVADESVTCAQDIARIVQYRAAQVVNVKLMKCGIVEALSIVLAAKAAGLGLMIGGMVEARLAMGTSACFAGGIGGFSYVDLDTPLFLAEDPFEGGYSQQGERIDLSPIELGHGLRPTSW